MALTDQVLMPGSDYQAICDATRALTGKTGTLKSGDISTELGNVTPQGETWVLNEALTVPSSNMSYAVDATTYSASLGHSINIAQIIMGAEHLSYTYLDADSARESVNAYAYEEWYDNNYRKLVFIMPPTDDLLTWLTANGTRQATDTAVQPEKIASVTGGTTEVTPDIPYDAIAKVNVQVPSATIATPSITVSSSGLITASTTQISGYVSNGIKSATKQLTTQAAKTITPSSSSQTAVVSGVYTTGAVTVAAIPSDYVGNDAPKTNCANILGNVSATAGTLSRTSNVATLNVNLGLSTSDGSALANKVIESGDEYVSTKTITVPTEIKSITNLTFGSGSYTNYSPTSGKLISYVTISKPSTLIASNIKSNVSIAGITGSYRANLAALTRLINDNAATKIKSISVTQGVISFTSTTNYSMLIAVSQSYSEITLYAYGAYGSAHKAITSDSQVYYLDSSCYTITKSGTTYSYVWTTGADSASYGYELGTVDVYGLA